MKRKKSDYPHKVDYEEVYKMIKVSENNKKLIKEAQDKMNIKYFPKNYEDIAGIYGITKQLVSHIKKIIENKNER